MAVTLTCALATGVVGPSPADQSGMVGEDIIITPSSSADGDTGTYTPSFLVPDRVIVGGGLEYSISGNVITFTTTAAMDNGTLIAARIVGYVS